MTKSLCRLLYFALLPALLSCSTPKESSMSWCDHPNKKGWENLTEIQTRYPWFKVYDVGDSVYAIFEPDNWQSVISYLIVGSNKALLFDTGMGLDSIQAVVRQLTPLPLSVIIRHGD
ncbi:MAG: hypothetical protein K1X47_07590 [Cyclobacteriaceae bacterium]|nr:hypothetical protein [Cyclobacteriaceae bacterium]